MLILGLDSIVIVKEFPLWEATFTLSHRYRTLPTVTFSLQETGEDIAGVCGKVAVRVLLFCSVSVP